MDETTDQGRISGREQPDISIPVGDKVIDRSILEEYVEMIGDTGVQSLLRLIEIFLGTSPGLLLKMDSSIRIGDFQGMRSSSHTLKSSSASLGAFQLSELCRDLEMQALAALEEKRSIENLTGFSERATAIRSEFGRVSQALDVIYKESQP